jgi:hypothetical protein
VGSERTIAALQDSFLRRCCPPFFTKENTTMSISFICLLAGMTAAADYPRPELLVEAASLVKAPAGLVLDVRTREKYLEGHVPGAVWVDVTA